MTVSLRLNDEDMRLIRNYAALHDISISELVRRAVLAQIEDEYDLEAYKKAREEYEKDPVTYSLDEVKKELGL